LCACTTGCSPHELVPALSVHAAVVLHRGRGRDASVTLQLGFGGARARPHVRERALVLESTPACEESALCEWSRMAEESALAALGVVP
jgi:hypothetical protein